MLRNHPPPSHTTTATTKRYDFVSARRETLQVEEMPLFFFMKLLSVLIGCLHLFDGWQLNIKAPQKLVAHQTTQAEGVELKAPDVTHGTEEKMFTLRQNYLQMGKCQIYYEL